MKSNKSLIALILAMIMCLALFAACGNKNVGTSTDVDEEVEATVNENDTNTTVEDDDWEYIENNGKMVIGYTVYKPMNYLDNDTGELTGFDIEFAKAVCEKLGVEPAFEKIVWDTKEIELNAKNIDCIWNGLTINEDHKETMEISDPYVKNMQVVVIKKDNVETYKTAEDLVDAKLVAEVGSAGEEVIDEEENLSKAKYTGVSKQTDALLEVKAGTSDAAVLDLTLANAMVGEGTDFDDLMMVDGLELAVEEYGIAFRKGSSVCEKVNEAIAALKEDGTLAELAEKYGLDLVD